MDSAEGNIYPVVSRGIGNPASPVWSGTLHEADPKFGSLGISRNVCFLIDPNGATDESNIDCSGTPPAAYGAVSGTTLENTKILPDGWFTPGTHIPIYAPEKIAETRPDVVLILPWNLKDEIVEQLAYVRDWGGKFAVPIPELTICE